MRASCAECEKRGSALNRAWAFLGGRRGASRGFAMTDANTGRGHGPRDERALVLRGVHALDASGSFSDPLDVVVIDGVVAAVAPMSRAPEGAIQVDGDGLWLMPGVFDCHVHVGMSSTDTLENLQTPLSLRTLKAARNLRVTLAAGVTHVRDAGGADAGLRAGIEEGLIQGPHLEISIVMLSQTGGHADGFLAGPGISMSVEDFLPASPGRPPFLVDGEDEMRRVVREVLRAGADWIKVCTTGGLFAGAHASGDAQLSVEEVAVAVHEAARRNRGVMAHAVGSAGIEVALQAGVRSIEHGIHLDERQAVRMAADNTYLVPSLAVYHRTIEMVQAQPESFPPAVREEVADVAPRLGQCVRIAHDVGVPIALGSDFANAADHGTNLAEIAYLHRAGLSVEEALLAATLRGAQLCGVDHNEGRIAPGCIFDAIVLDTDPGDLSCFLAPFAVTGVFRGGEAVVPHPRLLNARAATRSAPRR
jgi:imidazolonepropionase-like amidohydrolase